MLCGGCVIFGVGFSLGCVFRFCVCGVFFVCVCVLVFMCGVFFVGV